MVAITEIISEEAVKAVCEKFNSDYGLSLKINHTLKEQIETIIAEKNIDTVEFCNKTGYDSNRFYRMKRGEAPSMVTLVTFCMAFDISIQNTVEILRSLGVTFSPTDKVHAAYCYLISECRGKSLYDCNEILKGLSISEKHYLGDL